MGNLRVFWIIWCVGWAFFWFVAGFFTFFLAWIVVPFSLLAILIPVGAPTTAQPVGYQQPPPQQLPPWTGGQPAQWQWTPDGQWRWDGTKWQSREEVERG